MFETFFPDDYVASTYIIPFEKLYMEGFRGVIFDIDNTLVPHGAPADERAKKLFYEPACHGIFHMPYFQQQRVPGEIV